MSTDAPNEHPSAFRLEAHAAGGAPDPDTASHLERCEGCRAYLAQLAADGAAMPPVADFLAQVQARASAAGASGPPPARSAPARWMRYAAPLAAAAAIAVGVFVVRRPEGPDPISPADVRLKGAARIAAIRLRAGEQARFDGQVPVRAGDRLRFEVTVPDGRPFAAGLLDADGTFTPLELPPGLAAGVHLIDAGFTIDDRPTDATALAGPAEEVARAVRGESAPGVARLAIRSE